MRYNAVGVSLFMWRVTTLQRFYGFSFFSRCYGYAPIIILWLLRQGFPQTEVMVLVSCFFVSSCCAELPTGLFADRYGRKWALVLGSIAQALGAASLAIMSGSAAIAAGGQMLLGLGAAFHTGAKEAFLFDDLKERGQAAHYQRRYGEAKFFEFLAMGLAAVAGVPLYQLSGSLPFFLTAVCFGCGALVASGLPEPPRTMRVVQTHWRDLGRGWSEIVRGGPRLRSLIIYYSWFFSLVLIVTVSLTQPYLTSVGFPLPWFGWAHFFFYAFAMTGTLWSERLAGRAPRPRFFRWLGGGLAAVLLLLAVWQDAMMFLVLGVVYGGWGLLLPAISCAVNRRVASERRAVVLSFQDVAQTAVLIATAIGAGYCTDRYGLPTTLIALSLVSCGILLLDFFVRDAEDGPDCRGA